MSDRASMKLSSDEVINGLNVVLCDALVFHFKLRQYHWRVTGPTFFSLHDAFERLYRQWAEWVDDLAERILAVGGDPVPTLKSVLENARLNEDGPLDGAGDMIRATVDDMLSQRDRMFRVIEHAEEAKDRGTVNLLDGIRDRVEKDAWMLTAAGAR